MQIYADYAATAPLRPAALQAMTPWLAGTGFGNASSMYALAREAKRGLEQARCDVALALGVMPEEVFFTSGGTESDNWALKGVMEVGALAGKKHFITTAIEHPAIMQTSMWLERQGMEYTSLPADSVGRVSPESAADAVRPDTKLISVMYANNEIGTIQPVSEIFAAAKEKNPQIICHTDAVQAAGQIDLDIGNADMVSLSGHKMGGPKGIGVLVIRKGVAISPLMHGGHHERNRRSGTENVAGAAGLAAAITESVQKLPDTQRHLLRMRVRLIQGILGIPYSRLTGDPSKRLPGHASFVFESAEGESLVLGLDLAGISVSSGSACSSAALEASHVLLAIGLPHELAHGSVRFTLGAGVTEEEIDYIVETTKRVVAERRAISPVWDAEQNKPVPFETL
ncbi:MAG: aminotransferase class V-fold PLP-dependent enzyme [Oscillospiraceae bacterium]|jgi:cysteine desulfurase|nr:aminotransferase class V-fold PLP-dependent enzyme [Oscillospiraceae bacterium]